MKKSILIIGLIAFTAIFSSCEKEVIEVDNEPIEGSAYNLRSSSVGADSGADITDFVTDPNEDEDFDADKKNPLGPGK
jgi:hypothetical protein